MTTQQQLANLRERVSKLKAERAYWQDIAENRKGVIEQLRRGKREPRRKP